MAVEQKQVRENNAEEAITDKEVGEFSRIKDHVEGDRFREEKGTVHSLRTLEGRWWWLWKLNLLLNW